MDGFIHATVSKNITISNKFDTLRVVEGVAFDIARMIDATVIAHFIVDAGG